MNVLRKPRSDASLKNLPEIDQAKIADLCRTSSLRAAVKVLHKKGITTSRQALGRFYQWWRERQNESEQLKLAESIVRDLRAKNPNIGEHELLRMAKQLFIVQAMQLSQKNFPQALKIWMRLNDRLGT